MVGRQLNDSTYAFACLLAVDRVHGGNAAAAFLDGGDSWVSAAAQLRARVFLSLAGAVLFLCRVAARAECANLLPCAAGSTDGVCQNAALHRALFFAGASDSSAFGIRGYSRDAGEPDAEADCAARGVCSRALFRLACVSGAGEFAGVRFSGSGECARARLWCVAGAGDVDKRGVGNSFSFAGARSSTVLLSQFAGGGVCHWGGAGGAVARAERAVAARLVGGSEHDSGAAGAFAVGGADLRGAAVQFFANRAAEESRVCSVSHIFGAAVFELGAAAERLAGSADSAGGDRRHSVIFAGDFLRAVAAAAGTAVARDGAKRNGSSAALDGGHPAGGAARQ